MLHPVVASLYINVTLMMRGGRDGDVCVGGGGLGCLRQSCDGVPNSISPETLFPGQIHIAD